MKKLFIIFAVLCLAVPAMASDWNFYGSVRFATFWNNVDTDNSTLADDSDGDLLWQPQGNSRIGAKVKYNDEIGGVFEMSDSFGKRKLYGTYSWGGGELLIGQTYSPSSSYSYSTSVYDAVQASGVGTYSGDGALYGIGQFYTSRNPMIQVTVGDFKLALITPDVTGVGTFAAADTTDVTFPKIEAAYKFKSDMFFVDVFGGYQTYDIDNAGTANPDWSVDSYVVGLGGGVTLGAVYINVGGHMGQNLGNYDTTTSANPLGFDSSMDTSTGTEKDTDAYGFLAVIGCKASDMLTVEAGYGYVNYEKDLPNTQDEAGWQAYINATITITENFFIVPEIGYIEADYDVGMATADPNPSVTYVGAKWQINF